MYDEIYKAWLNIKSKSENNELKKIKNKILDYLNYLQNIVSSRNGILRKICEAKIANLKLIIDFLEEHSPSKVERITLAENNEKHMTAPQDIRVGQIESERKQPKYLIIRLLQSIPTIVGSDLENYGPFDAEDIVTLPVKNALALIKRNAAVEINWGGRNENG